MSRLKRNIDIIIILIVGFALRFTISFTHSYSNDELSAINRLQYDSFSSLIEDGVKTGDMHPAGVQLFMKGWSQIAGVSELGMRFPFVICGTLSILLIFMIGNRWVNRQTGLIAAILLALLYFPIMNSEFARPYSPGLMFCLLAGWYYLKILFDANRTYRDAILLGLVFSAAMYTHHFAFMFVGWMGFSGLLFLKKENYKHIIWAASIAILLYIPHISITQHQLGVGGLQWLGPPDKDWLFQFVFYAFNESWLVVGTLFGFALLSIFYFSKPDLKNKRVLILSAIWFFGIYILAHVYSVMGEVNLGFIVIKGSPILKFPVMLFALPFFFLPISFWFSRFKHQGVLFAVLMLVLAGSTARERELYGNMHYELFEEIAEDIVRWNDDYGEENIYTVYNINNPNYMNFYANQWDKEVIFDWDVFEFGDEAQLREDLLLREEDYCIVGYSARLTLPQVFETCKEFYPNILEYKKYNNSAVFLLSRSQQARLTQKKAVLANCTPNSHSGWNFENEILRLDSLWIGEEMEEDLALKSVYQKSTAFYLDETYIYGPTFEFTLDQIEKPYEKYIKVSVQASMEPEAQLTAFVSATRDGELLMVRDEPFWQGSDLETMIRSSRRRTGYFVFKIHDLFEEDDILKIGLWARNPASKIAVESIQIEVYDNIWN